MTQIEYRVIRLDYFPYRQVSLYILHVQCGIELANLLQDHHLIVSAYLLLLNQH